MRNQFLDQVGVFCNFKAVVTSFSTTKTYKKHKQKTVLLTSIKNSFDESLCQHIWIKLPKLDLKLKTGDLVSFEAMPQFYLKGRKESKRLDICLKYVQKIKRVI